MALRWYTGRVNQKLYIAVLAGVVLALVVATGIFGYSIVSRQSAPSQTVSAPAPVSHNDVAPDAPSLAEPEVVRCADMAGKEIPYPAVRNCKDESGIVVDRALWKRIVPYTYEAVRGLLNPERDPDVIVQIQKTDGAFLKGEVGRVGGGPGAGWIAKKTTPTTWEIIARYNDIPRCADLDAHQAPRSLEPNCSW